MSWDLPPGCTHKDIEDRFGDDSYCEDCEEDKSVNDLNDDGVCAECAQRRKEMDEEGPQE